DRSCDNLAADLPLPAVLARAKLETREVVPVIALAIGIGHVDLAPVDGRHAHQGIAKPLLPDARALDREDFQLTAFGIEGEVAVLHGGGRGAVVLGLILPDDPALESIEGVEIVTTKAAAEEDTAIDHGGRRQGTLAWNGDFPACNPPVLAEEGRRRLHPR